MQNRVYTILIVSKGQKAPHNLQISLGLVGSLCAVLCLMFSGAFLFFRSYIHLSGEAQRMAILEEEAVMHQDELERLGSELNTLVDQMAELDALGEQVRDLVAPESEKNGTSALSSRSGVREAATPQDHVSYLKDKLPQTTEKMSGLLSEAEAYMDRLAVTPDIWPVLGRITSSFGWRKAPVSRRTTFHQGIDIGAPFGTPVKATADGLVIEARYRRGWGNLVVVDHGTYITYYGHLRKIFVKEGTFVTKSQLIAEVGSSGYSTGPHLHYEINQDGKPIDPLKIIRQQEVSVNGF